MTKEFRPPQAEEIARAFLDEGVEYLFIGKSGAILLGYPGTTQDVDLVFAPDGIASFAEAKSRKVSEGIFQVANRRAIIASKRASGRKKDEIELPLLESFRAEYEKRHAPPLRSAGDVAAETSRGK